MACPVTYGGHKKAYA